MQLENQAQDPTLDSPITDGVVFPGRLPEVHGDSTKWYKHYQVQILYNIILYHLQHLLLILQHYGKQLNMLH
eukprot:UN08285